MRTILTKSNIKFIRANRLLMSGSSMAKKFGVSESVVQRYMRNNSLTAPKKLYMKWKGESQRGKTSSSPYLDKIFKDWYLFIPIKTLANLIDRSDAFVRSRFNQLGLVVPPEIAEQRKKDNAFKPGHLSHNKGKKQTDFMSPEAIERSKKGWFKKGIVPQNTKERNGIIVIRNSHPNETNSRLYKYIRIRPGVWQELHRYRWEKRRGKIPSGHSLWFRDQNPMNCTLKNLELITNAEKMRRNSIQRYPAEIKTSFRLIGKLKKRIYEKQNN